MRNYNLTSIIDDKDIQSLKEEELTVIEGGIPQEHVGYWVSMIAGPTYHLAWNVGYFIERFY